MAMKSTVSISVIRRLPRYYRFLGELKNEGVSRISSKELSQKMGLTASQIRQDLNCFGGFGQQGYGYNVTSLYDEIAHILGLDVDRPTVLIGAGNLGKAVATLNFVQSGFRLCGIFDNSPQVVGSWIANLSVQHVDTLEAFCKVRKPVTALLCVPRTEADSISKRLIACGVKGFLNFSHYDIGLDNDEVVVENVHLMDSLRTLSYRMHEKLDAPSDKTEV